jgi:hypothetical protein
VCFSRDSPEVIESLVDLTLERPPLESGGHSAVVEGILGRSGHTFVHVANGREAVETVGRELFDLIFMDVQMPKIDGFEAVRQIREAGEPLLPLTSRRNGLSRFCSPNSHIELMNSAPPKSNSSAWKVSREPTGFAHRSLPSPSAAHPCPPTESYRNPPALFRVPLDSQAIPGQGI